MLGLRVFATDRPTGRGMAGAPILPMSAEDQAFWRWFRNRPAASPASPNTRAGEDAREREEG